VDHDKLPAPAALILATAADGPVHGYAIGKEVERRTDGQVRLGATTLYRVVRQLLESGYLAEAAAPRDAGSDDERRRYFRITHAGRRALEAEVRRLRSVLRATESAVLPKGSRS
jgi:DNA-binding PadR family transcriptional regulator